MTDHRTLEAKQYDDIFSPREISKIKQELFWVMQPKPVDRLTLEIYRDLLNELREQTMELNLFQKKTDPIWVDIQGELQSVYWTERANNIKIEIETLNTILT